MIKGLHHAAYRCRDSEETRKFYEDFLGLPLVNAIDISETMTGRATHTLHTFYRMDDGSCLAFFEAPDMPFEFKRQHDYDLHIAVEVSEADLQKMFAKGKAEGVETPRGLGPSHHPFDLFPRPERLCRGTDCQDPDPRRSHEPRGRGRHKNARGLGSAQVGAHRDGLTPQWRGSGFRPRPVARRKTKRASAIRGSTSPILLASGQPPSA